MSNCKVYGDGERVKETTRAFEEAKKQLERSGSCGSGTRKTSAITTRGIRENSATFEVDKTQLQQLYEHWEEAVALAKGVSKGMLIEKLKIPVAILMMTALVGTGAGVAAYRVCAQESEVAAYTNTESKPLPPSKTERPRKHVTSPAEQPKDEKVKCRTAKFKELLPDDPPPVQALVILGEDGRLSVSRKVTCIALGTTVQTLKNGQKRQETTPLKGYCNFKAVYDFDTVRVYDTKGRVVKAEELRKRLKGETIVLVSADGNPVCPLHLRLYKEDTLVFVLPSQALRADPIVPPATPVETLPTFPVPSWDVDDPEESMTPSGS